MRYGFNVFNLTNTTSMDVPQNSTQIGQKGACANSLQTGTTAISDCSASDIQYVRYGMVATNQADQGMATSGPPGGGTAGTNLFEKPYTGGTSGKSTMIPTNIPLSANVPQCTAANVVTTNPVSACVNNGANFGSVTDTIGSNRIVTMDLHIIF
jgi:hypothetical protein